MSDEGIKKNSRVGIRFSNTEPISVFVRLSTTLAELQNRILQKIGVAGSKHVAKLFYRAPVAVVSEHVKYGLFVVHSDVDLEVIFHCRRDFSEVRTTELYAKLEDVVASSDGSNPNPTSNRIGGSSSSAPVASVVPVIPPCVASPSFVADLHNEDDNGCDLGDNRTFGELVPAVPTIRATDDDHYSIPAGQSVPSSFGSREYPTHFSALDLEAVAPSQEENDVGVGFGGGGSVDVLTPNEFQIGQVFQTKEDDIPSMKSYSIRRGVEYKVKESDHAKYHARCKNFASGCE
ncbi:hypothetical protein PIB30_106478, partial [Stylosanthes scabra]|nr:hypothetical protein [Stylosanthes scabra]